MAAKHAENRGDAVRDQWLAAHRYRVLRFWNNEVLANVEGGLGYDLRGSVGGDAPSPRPSPRERGEGVV